MTASEFNRYRTRFFSDDPADNPNRLPTDLSRLEGLASEVLAPGPFGFISGGAGTGTTARANRAALDRWRIVPRVMRDVSERDLSTRLFDTTLPTPLFLGPVGALAVAHQDKDIAVARAAAPLGVPFATSSGASTSMEEVAACLAPDQRWLQLYWPSDLEVTQSLLRRAGNSGYRVLIVPLDVPLPAWRPSELDAGYRPYANGEGMANFLSDPVFRKRLAGDPTPEAADAVYRSLMHNTARNWSDLRQLRELWDGRLVLKGILHPQDAECAVEAGVDGVMVSNHGGRQIDGAIASVDALPDVVAAVAGRVPVLFDSGVRTGADVFKALALGASAVAVARPYVYGLALAGQQGVDHVLRTLLAELDLLVGLAGCTRIPDIDGQYIRQIPAPIDGHA